MAKEALLRRVWPEGTVDENNLAVAVSALRRALRETVQQPTYIRTVSGRGYRFAAPVHQGDPVSAAASPSIAILPFATRGDAAAQEHFGDGIAEDLIAELSRNRWLTVIARQSSFTFRGIGATVQDMAAALNARYVLDGSVRFSGARVRVSAHLFDGETNASLVAERYDSALADLFDLQDEITSRIVTAVRPALYDAEEQRSIRRHPESIDAWSAYQRGTWHFVGEGAAESAAAQAWFRRAMAIDPRYAPGYYGLAQVLIHDWTAFRPHAQPHWREEGEHLAERAVVLDPLDSGAHTILALARRVRGDHAGALAASAEALRLNPSDAAAHGVVGATLIYGGRPIEGLAALATSMRLSPRDPRLRVRQAQAAMGHYFAGDLAAAVAASETLIRRWPEYAVGYRVLATALSEQGELERGRAALSTAIALSPAPFDNFVPSQMTWYRPEDHARVLAALRRVGLPSRN